MKTIEIYKTRKDELVKQTLNLLPSALSGDKANRTFYFKLDEDKIIVDYIYYTGNISLSENCFLTIKDYETPNPSEYGYDTIEEMDFQACGYDEFIEQSIEGKIGFLEIN